MSKEAAVVKKIIMMVFKQREREILHKYHCFDGEFSCFLIPEEGEDYTMCAGLNDSADGAVYCGLPLDSV